MCTFLSFYDIFNLVIFMRYKKISSLSNEIINKFMIRKSRSQKSKFIELIKDSYNNDVVVEKSFFGRNIVVGDLKRAKYIFTAHYDTCPTLGVLPNFITPKNIFIFIMYQIFLSLIIFGFSFLVGCLCSYISKFFNTDIYMIVFFASSGLSCLLICFQLLFGISNKKNFNDNTSGVITLIELIKHMPAEFKSDVCYVFFDNEEKGLLGSIAFKQKHSKYINDKIIFNFDCVSDGDNFLFVYKRLSADIISKLYNSFKCNNKTLEIIKSGKAIYPSDQSNFKHGVGICALKKNKFFGLYMNRIHTNRDIIFMEENIIILVEMFINFVCDINYKFSLDDLLEL